jgi:hypothetical protein
MASSEAGLDFRYRNEQTASSVSVLIVERRTIFRERGAGMGIKEVKN